MVGYSGFFGVLPTEQASNHTQTNQHNQFLLRNNYLITIYIVA
jgi:hypothetical protein